MSNLRIRIGKYKHTLRFDVYFQIKLKIQNEKLNPLPDPFALDWDNLSETEMKRLVGQLEKTKAELQVRHIVTTNIKVYSNNIHFVF